MSGIAATKRITRHTRSIFVLLSFAVMGLLLLVVSDSLAAQVTNFKAKQVGKDIVFTFDVAEEKGEQETWIMVLITVGAKEYTNADLHIDGDYGNIKIGTGKKITWKVPKDFPNGFDVNKDWGIKITVDQERFAEQKKKALEEQQKRAAEEKRKVLEEERKRIAEQKRKAVELAQELVNAASFNEIAKVKTLIATGLDVNTKDKDGNTALEAAACLGMGNTEIVRILIAAGADVNATNKDGKKLLEYLSSINGNAEIVRVLIAAGANVNAKDKDGRTALMWASNNGNTEIVQAFIAGRANLNAKDKNGDTALMDAASNGHTETVRTLITAGADVNARDNLTWTALQMAANYGHTETVRALIAGGANVNVRNEYGRTLLWLLIRDKGNAEVIQLLKQAGARE